MTPEALARLFHETYETLAPHHGYETRKESARPWEEVPEKNRKLMIMTCDLVLQDKQMTAERDKVYRERDACVAAMARMAQLLGYRCGLGKHSESDSGWDPEWLNIVYIEFPHPSNLPAQASWHIHDSELPLFSFLPPYDEKWDGHSTEEKYQHMAHFCGVKP